MLALCAALVMLFPGSPMAQLTAPSIRLTEFPSFVGPADVMRIGVEVTNDSSPALTNLRIGIAIHDAIQTRSHLERTFQGRLGAVVGSDTIQVEGEVSRGTTSTFVVEKPVSEISLFRSQTADRAYPVVISLRSGTREIAKVSTYLVFFSAPPPVKLDLSLVVPIHTPSPYGDGKKPNIVTSGVLERALSGGRLSRLIAAIGAFESPVTIAPSGLLLDSLADLAGGYVRLTEGKSTAVTGEDPRAQRAAALLDELRRIAARPETRVIAVPYSAAFLPGLARAELAERAQAQVAEGLRRTAGVLGSEPIEGWLVPLSALDERTFSDLHTIGTRNLVLDPGTLLDDPRGLSRGTPVELQTRTGAVLGALLSDRGLDESLLAAEEMAPLLARQRFLAETATIYHERPALARVVSAVAPNEWSASQETVSAIFAGLASSSWISMTTPDAAIAKVEPVKAGATRGRRAQPDTPQLAPIEDVVGSGPPNPEGGYFAAMREAMRAIDRYSDLNPPAERLSELERRLLVAESGDWWQSRASAQRGLEFARGVDAAVKTEFGKIRAPAEQTITFTARSGVIPVSIASDLDYPVDVVIRLDSDKLRFPKGNRIRRRLQPPNQTIEVQTIAQATGTFPLQVVVETPSSGAEIASSRMVVRSTAYNVVAVAITSGAALFLIGSWVISTVRKRAVAG